MAYKFYKWFPHGLADYRVRCYDIRYGEERKQNAYSDYFQCLQEHIFASETRKTLIPYGRQQLLDVGMCNELKSKKVNLQINVEFLVKDAVSHCMRIQNDLELLTHTIRRI